MMLLYFISSLFFLAPFLAMVAGVFYSLSLVSTIDHFMKGKLQYSLAFSSFNFHRSILYSPDNNFLHQRLQQIYSV